MAKPTLAEGLITMITDEGTYDYVPCILSNKIGNIGILVFLDGDPESPFAIIDNR